MKRLMISTSRPSRCLAAAPPCLLVAFGCDCDEPSFRNADLMSLQDLQKASTSTKLPTSGVEDMSLVYPTTTRIDAGPSANLAASFRILPPFEGARCSINET